MLKCVGVNVEMGDILKIYVARRPAYWGELNSETDEEGPTSKLLEVIVIEADVVWA